MAIPAWLTIISWIFIALGLMPAAGIVADICVLGYREHVKIMEAVRPLTALHTGPAGLAAYLRWGRPTSQRWMTARNRDMPGRPFWAGTAVARRTAARAASWGDVIAEWDRVRRRPPSPGAHAAS